MSVYKKLQQARIKLQNTKLNKSGHNKFAGYKYFELADFLPAIQNICAELGLCGAVSFTNDMAYLTIYDVDGDDKAFTTFTSPMSSASLKGCHDVQNLGAVQTYLRRYLWVNAFEIVEHDALDSGEGVLESKPIPKSVSEPVVPAKPKTNMVAWQLKVDESQEDWGSAVKVATNLLLDLVTEKNHVSEIFKINRSIYDKLKEVDMTTYDEIMANFKNHKEKWSK